MNYNEISNLVTQNTIPDTVQKDVLARAKAFINDGFEVEAVANITSVILDVYDDEGVRVDRIKTTFSKDYMGNVPITKDVSPDNLELFE